MLIKFFPHILGNDSLCNCVRDWRAGQCDRMRCHCQECINAHSNQLLPIQSCRLRFAFSTDG